MLVALMAAGCSSKQANVQSSQVKVGLEQILDQELSLTIPAALFPITKTQKYALDCRGNYYSDFTIGGELLSTTSVKIATSHEKQVLYVESKTAKYFGADYDVIQDDESYLIIMRSYPGSGLTEVVSVNKKTGIGFDTRTLMFSITGAPTSDTYAITCEQV